jgi:hypothetical protein
MPNTARKFASNLPLRVSEPLDQSHSTAQALHSPQIPRHFDFVFVCPAQEVR